MLWLYSLYFLLPALTSAAATQISDFAAPCYSATLPNIAPSADNRTVPWGSPSVTFPNGTTCCDTLDQVRAGIDSIDNQLLDLLSQRATFVREATRFKATRSVVDVLARDAEVIDGAVHDAPTYHLPQTVASAVFSAIINSSVPFELCVFDEYDSEC